jgi:hypothetical protein
VAFTILTQKKTGKYSLSFFELKIQFAKKNKINYCFNRYQDAIFMDEQGF